MAVAKKRKRKKSLILRLAVIMFVGYVTVSMVMLQMDIMQRKTQLDELKQQVEDQRIANKEIERLTQMGDNDEYMGRIAREMLDYTYPDETIYKDSAGN